MIRIIQGIYKGRFLKIPDSKVTRPTRDKVRQAIFNAVYDKVLSSTCLDLFAGSGARGLEALSRGAKTVYFNDKNFQTFKILKENIFSLSPEKDSVFLSLRDYRLFLKKNQNVQFDLVFLDPPYKRIINASVIQERKKRNRLKDGAIVVSEQETKNEEIDGFTLKEYHYGQKSVGIYRREEKK